MNGLDCQLFAARINMFVGPITISAGKIISINYIPRPSKYVEICGNCLSIILGLLPIFMGTSWFQTHSTEINPNPT